MTPDKPQIADTGERMLPTEDGEVSVVFSRHKFAYEHVRQFVTGKTVLDVGCGSGYGCKILAEEAKFVCGIDQSEEATSYCQQHFAADNIEFRQVDANALSFEQKFDVAVTFQVIEHMPDLNNFVSQLKHAVKPNGSIFITTPNVKEPEKNEGDNPFHCNEMNYAQFEKLMRNHFTNFRIQGVAFAEPNRLRSVLAKLPFYKLGRMLKRKSGLKKLATRALDLTSFRIIASNLEGDAADFLAVCKNG